MRLHLLALVSLAVLAAPPSLHPQVGIAARASTLGLGVELSYRLNRNLGGRLSGNYFQFSKDADVQNIAYHVTPRLESGTAIVDLYPLGGGFHLSGGLLLNENQGRLVARLTSNIQIGDQTYTPQQVGSLIGTISFRKTAPYLGLGFAGRGRVSFLFDLGVGFTGTPRAGLVGQTNLTGQAKTEFDANVVKERDEVQAKINDQSLLKYHPVLSFGLKIGL